jgi:hypothetical protein
MISSTMPSAKYSCSGSPLMFGNGKTAIDGLSGSARAGSGTRCPWVTTRKTPHRPCDVLKLLLADVFEDQVEPAYGILLYPRRHADPARLGKSLEPGRDVDPVAKDVAILDNDVADVDADAQFDPIVCRGARVALGHRLLHLDCVAHRIDHAELDQQAVAGGLDDAAMMLDDLRIEEFAAQSFEAFERAFLIRPHQPRIPRHIGGEDRGQPAGLAHVASPAANRRPER